MASEFLGAFSKKDIFVNDIQVDKCDIVIQILWFMLKIWIRNFGIYFLCLRIISSNPYEYNTMIFNLFSMEHAFYLENIQKMCCTIMVKIYEMLALKYILGVKMHGHPNYLAYLFFTLFSPKWL